MSLTFPMEWNCSDTHPYLGGVQQATTPVLFGTAPAGSTTTRSQLNVRAGTHSTRMNIVTQNGNNGDEQVGWDMIGFPDDYSGEVIGSDIYYHCVLTIMPGFDWGPSIAKTKSGRSSGQTINRVSTRYFRKTGIGVAENDGTTSGGLAPANPPNYAVGNDDSNCFVNFNMDTYADGLPHEFIVRVKANTITGATAPTDLTSLDAVLQVWIDNTLIGTLNNWRLHNNSGNLYYDQWWGDMISPYFQLGGTTAGYGGVIYASEHFTNNSKASIFDLSRPTSLVIS